MRDLSGVSEPRSDPQLVEDQTEVLAFLSRPDTYGIDEAPRRIDTHGAAVFLAGDHAWKMKRAVRYPFLDFSTIDKRKAVCEAELEVNRRNAPDLYLGLVPVIRQDGALRLGGDGTPIEWLVKMRRFDPDDTFDHVADRGGLTPDLLSALVARIVRSHDDAPPGDGAAATDRLLGYIRDNTAEMLEAPDAFDPARVQALGEASEAAFAAARPVLDARAPRHVRRCHGDLHLRNLVLIDGAPVLFDALEFDPAMATSDVFYDLAFLLMDLWERGLYASANVVLNRYLWLADDDSHLDALTALPLMMSVRAAIRAKVTAASLTHVAEDTRDATLAAARRYFDTAESLLAPAPPCLVAIGGLSGSGKTTVAAGLTPFMGRPPGAVHLRSDIVRKRMFAVTDTDRLPEDAYAMTVTEDVYDRLRRQAGRALDAGAAVIVDAVHERAGERAAVAAVAEVRGVPFAGLWLEAPEAELVRRVTARTGDASDADAAIVRQQVAREPEIADWPRIESAGGPEEARDAALARLREKSQVCIRSPSTSSR